MMKTLVLTLFAALFMLTGCKKEIKLEVKRMTETEKNDLWDINIQRSVFLTTEASVEESCVVFNDKLTGMLSVMQDSIRAQAQELQKGLLAMGLPMIAPCALYVRDSVYMANEDYISVRLLVYVMTGGAHGNTTFYGLNYDVKTKQFLTNKEVVDYGKAKEIDGLLKTHFVNRDSCFNEIPTLETMSALNFTKNTVDFTYAQYVLGAYACGYMEVAVPRKEMKDALLVK